MRLYTRTPAGHGIGIAVQLTGQSKESDGKLCAVEISLPNTCAAIDGYALTDLPKTPYGCSYLWADPGDLCADDGSLVSQAELRAAIVNVNDHRREDAMCGPLGEHWP